MYIADPAWCEILYSYSIINVEGDAVLTLDAVGRTFSFNYTVDLDLCGLSSTDYQIAVTGTSGPIVPQSDTATFTLTLKNPCIDPTFV